MVGESRPTCFCGKEAISFFKGKFVCGDCMLNAIQKQNEEFWSKVENDKIE